MAIDINFLSLKEVPIDLLVAYIDVKIVIRIVVVALHTASIVSTFDIFLAFIIPIVAFSYFYEINFQLANFIFSYFQPTMSAQLPATLKLD